MKILNESEFKRLCDFCSEIEPKLKAVILKYDYPPFWHRNPDFATLVLTILEQQVSLASAKAAFNKLTERNGSVTPEKLVILSDEELRACYFSRQKAKYVKILANEIISGNLNLNELNTLSEKEIRDRLIQIKGIGNWTIDIYLMMSLNFEDIFPSGDLATIKSVFELDLVPPQTSKEEIALLMKKFSPYRTVATYIFWHSYIKKRNLYLE